ncbi:helix-turn-helix domain-containing protein [Streptomyces sp. NRRL F-5053]|uniref:helix-turn-helix domain-containing protein n=1 Tax=Streptomyces sp. NRRL F-5053 TaxID=1463854 RepID=UPI00068E967C|nr:helix-turn-helix domain-containing protein [Streptomyces sp. NRRL F-5053]
MASVERGAKHGAGGPGGEAIAFGERLRILRTRRGMTREVLAGLLGRSDSWVKQVERGRLQMPKLPMLLRIAEVLRVADLAELTGDPAAGAVLFTGPSHPKLPAVRAAMDAFPEDGPGAAPAVEELRDRLRRAWAVRHASPHHRDAVGALLPSLIEDARRAAGQAESPAERRAAQAVLAQVYGLAQFFLAYQPDAALLWRAVERCTVAAHESGDPHAVAVAAWLSAQAHRDSGHAHFDAADAVTRAALRYLEPHLPDGGTEVLAMAGALRFEAAYTAARRGDKGDAWRHWDAAGAVARRLPADSFHPVTSFSRAVMGAHAVTVAVELHAGGESARQAAAADATRIPSRPRRARHRIEAARGFQLAGRPDEALSALHGAWEAAPETIRYNGYARRILLEESEVKSAGRRRRACELAQRIGMLSA